MKIMKPDDNSQNPPKMEEKNTLAGIGFCLSFIGFVGLIVSIIALVNSKKMNGSGRRLAIAGIVISSLITLAAILVQLYIYTDVLDPLREFELHASQATAQ